MMKKILFTSLFLIAPLTQAYAAESVSSEQLAIQKSAALPAHKTTRIEWIKFPQPQYKNDDLKEQNRAAILRVHADETGKITQASVQESTGLRHLDDILVQAVKNAQVKPHMINDTALATIGFQTFNLKYYDNNQEQCSYTFNSNNWIAQSTQQETPFVYLSQPQLHVDAEMLNQHDRNITFGFKVDKNGYVKNAKIKKGSGIYDLDQMILESISSVQIEVPRKYGMYKKSRLKDEIQFLLEQCL